MYLRNTWYVLARSDEIGDVPVPVQVLGERIVAFRGQDGTVWALEDACPHRKLPLSLGKRDGDRIVCGYHGLTFDGHGRCVAAPTQKQIPAGARVKSYPTAQRWGLVWIYMGGPETADPAQIIGIDNDGEGTWGLTAGDSMICRCNYLYLVDNLLDPSHVAWVHAGSFASAGTEDTRLEIRGTAAGIVVSRWILDVEPPAYYAPLVKFKGKCDRLQHYEVRYPGLGINKSIFTPSGTGGPDKPLDRRAYVMISYHFLTPVDDDTTRYFWLQNRNTDAHDSAITAQIAAGARRAFEEDRVVLEAVHKGMSSKTTPNLDLTLDAGALRFRRGLKALIEQEARCGSS